MSIGARVGLAAAVLLGLILVGTLWSGARERAQLREQFKAAALRADSAVAAADTTRRVALSRKDSIRILGDTARAVERRAVQADQRADALDRALRRDRITRAELTATVEALRAQASGTVTEGADSVRRGQFHVRQEPWTADVGVALPRPGPGAQGTIDLRVVLDSVNLDIRNQCGAPGPDGIRPATTLVSGPSWLRVGVRRAEQDPGLCRSPALAEAKPRWCRPGVGPAAGYFAAASGGALGVGFVAGYFCGPRR